MYIIKIKGTHHIPDYIQIRDEDFTLVAYFKITRPGRALSRCNLTDKTDEILNFAQKLPYGIVRKLDI
ncbi:MAG: fructose-6-phosphate aldolase [Bacteroidota bacterium]|nr:fructose-6-phosphate aldolase [Bacteroidota bacterium]